MLNYIVEELIPWYNENNDLSSIDIIYIYIYIYIYIIQYINIYIIYKVYTISIYIYIQYIHCIQYILYIYIYIYIYIIVYIQASTGMCHTCMFTVCMHISFIYRPFQGIRGFSRETFIAITTNIESQ